MNAHRISMCCSGVYNEPACSVAGAKYPALIVGYGTDSTGGDYWIVKNSWGIYWGNQYENFKKIPVIFFSIGHFFPFGWLQGVHLDVAEPEQSVRHCFFRHLPVLHLWLWKLAQGRRNFFSVKPDCVIRSFVIQNWSVVRCYVLKRLSEFPRNSQDFFPTETRHFSFFLHTALILLWYVSPVKKKKWLEITKVQQN